MHIEYEYFEVEPKDGEWLFSTSAELDRQMSLDFQGAITRTFDRIFARGGSPDGIYDYEVLDYYISARWRLQ